MDCPACGKGLQGKTVGDVNVDVCDGGCGGIWFDVLEIKKLDEKHETAGEELLGLKKTDGVQVDHEGKRECPKCDGQKMMRHFVSIKNEIDVDECPACGGYWLDYGELGRMRGQYDTEKERNGGILEYMDKQVGTQLEAMRKESEEQVARAKQTAKMFRFICPSNYIPGKQEWGAF